MDVVTSRIRLIKYYSSYIRSFIHGPPSCWSEGHRFLLRSELDAAYFHLSLGPPNEWGTDNPQLREMFPYPCDAADYIMESFPIVKREDEKQYGEYRTKRGILEVYDAMQMAIDTGQPCQTMGQWDRANWPSLFMIRST